MKAKLINVLVGAVVIAAVLYYFYPLNSSYEGFESNPGAILGMVFAGILGFGILIAFFFGMGQSSSD